MSSDTVKVTVAVANLPATIDPDTGLYVTGAEIPVTAELRVVDFGILDQENASVHVAITKYHWEEPNDEAGTPDQEPREE